MERRVFLTLILCTLFTIVYMSIMRKDPPEKAAGTVDETVSGPATSGGEAGGAPEPEMVGPGQPEAAPAPLGEFDETDVGEVEIRPFESEDLRIEFSSLGAGLSQVHLKKYHTTAAALAAGQEGTDHWVSVFPPAKRSFGNALILRELDSPGRPARYLLDRKHWEVVRDEEGPGGERTLEFRFDTADGLRFLKRFTLHPDEHFVRVVIGLMSRDDELGGTFRELLLRAAGGISDVERGQWTLEPEGVAMIVGEHGETTVRRYSASNLEGSPETVVGQGSSSVAWGGCANLYFAALLAPDRPGDATLVDLQSVSEDLPEKIQSELVVPLRIAREGQLTEVSLRYYVGPKDPALLEVQGLMTFQPLIEEDYGAWTSFRWINKLLLLVMKFFHGFVGNWGVAIILLTLLVRICIFPITRTQQVSMQRYSQKMQVLKPKLDALKEKYKDKPKRFQQEQMKLLKEHNAKPPLLGCLTMFITFPVFIGMFQILRTSIDLRQAPFVGWIDDLSLPDAMFGIPGVSFGFNLLPILATAAFVAQMISAPKPADPQAQQQQKIMYIMPVVFGVMFYNYAAGLSLYMLTSSLYGMFETKVIRKKFFPVKQPA